MQIENMMKENNRKKMAEGRGTSGFLIKFKYSK